GSDRPGGIRPAATADCARQALAARRVARRIKPRYAGRAIVAGQPDAADPPHRALAPQGNRPTLGKRIDKAAVKRQKAVWLPLAEALLELGPRFVVLRVDRSLQQRLGDDRVAVLALGLE